MRLAIAHDESPERRAPPHARVWQTCLRTVTFAETVAALPDARAALSGPDAYALLLEVLCGLRSPIVGETQVVGQFKAFLASADADAWISAIGQRLLTDAREIRAAHLIGLGARTYGSAVRSEIGAVSRVAILGTGALAAELLPFLTGPTRTVDIWGRRAACPLVHGPDASYHRVDDGSGADTVVAPAALVVAAPVSAAAVAAVAARYANLAVVVDLRGGVEREPVDVAARTLTLDDIFGRIEQAASNTTTRVAAARADIARRSEAFADSARLRPFGWDDLCA